MYSIAYDEQRRQVTATLRGFWNPDTVARYAADLFAVIGRIDRSRGPFHMLARSAELAIQSPETVKAFNEFMAEFEQRSTGRVAITVGTMLNKIQASRALANHRIRIFVDEDEALAWLSEETFVPASSVERRPA